MELQGRTALVTGGARGIGRELTRLLVEQGCHVVALGRDPASLEEVERSNWGMVTPWRLDLADREALEAALRDLPGRWPDLSLVINNAGVQAAADFVAGEAADRLEDLRRELAVNVEAVVALSAAALPVLRTRSDAALVNITSGLALAPKKSAPVYCASKAAVRTFTRALRYQCEDAAPHVRVVDVVLPLVDTDMTRGRGGGKIPPARAASAIVAGLRRGRNEIHVGKAALLPPLLRLAPSLAYRTLRNG